MLDRKVGKYQSATRRDRLRFANHIPRGCEPWELAGEGSLQPAVVSARRTGGKDRITGPELQRETAAVEDAVRSQAEAWTPRQEGHELSERPAIEAGGVTQRETSPQD